MPPHQRAELDSFNLTFPFPLRVGTVLLAGFWGWGVNLQYLHKKNIDVPALIRYPTRQFPHQRSHHASTYHLATLLTVPLVICFLVFWAVTHGNPDRVHKFDFIPQSFLFIALFLLLLPYSRLARSGRHRLLTTLRRISIGGLAEAQDGKFGDVLLADALTSYSKVLGDLFVCCWMFFDGDTSSTEKPNRSCGPYYAVPLFWALPSLIRFRQCLIEYVRVRRAGHTGGQHLANALKYASAFPPIFVTAKLRNYNPFESYGFTEMGMTKLLFVVSFINAAYSFYWDVTMDWDFTLFTSSRDGLGHSYGLRRNLYLSSNRSLYYGVIATDLILRFTWLCRFIPSVTFINRESGIFVINSLEAFRRWVWIFFRVEAEWDRNNRGSAPDDVLLGDFKVASGTRLE